MDTITSLLPTDTLKDCICNPVKHVYSVIKSYKGNLELLQVNIQKLSAMKDDIGRKVELGESNLQEVTNEAKVWLQSVGLLLDDEQVKDLLNEDFRRARDQCCFRLIPCNLYRRYEMSKVAKLKADAMSKLTNHPQDPVTLPIKANDLDPIPMQHCQGLDSRAVVEQRILELLKDDEVDAVALCGMGGVGKTTLAKSIKNEGAKDMFDAISMVEISQDVNIYRIQDHIAASIDLSLDGKESSEQRATRLYNALKLVKPKRSENNQQTKILMIIDNIWTYLDLKEVGIPFERTPQFWCKILLTSRERRVCKSMGVPKKNMVDVNMLGDHESRSLFWEHIRNADDLEVDKSLEDRLLRSCGGLPLSIVLLAKSLSGQDVSTWQYFADELEKSISCRSDDVIEEAYPVIETSYKFIRKNEKKMFFLLACLYPFGFNIPIEDVMRFGIGLNLFGRANSVIEVIKHADHWTDELISSSLLLEDGTEDKRRKVKIHDVVRSCGILSSEKDGHKLMVGHIPRWQLDDESWKKFTAISLTNDSDFSGLGGVQFDMLQTLLLSPTTRDVKLYDGLFMGMPELKILVLPRLGSGLPKSMRKLSHLRTLHLEECDLRDEDIEFICELEELVVLSLRGSNFERLPNGIKKLSNLRLLDLRDCRDLTTIPANVLSSLTQLEGLYMLNSYESKWEDNNGEIEQGATARIADLRSLHCLTVLEIQVTRIQQVTSEMMEFITNKNKLIFYANKYYSTSFFDYDKSMKFSGVDFEVGIGHSLEWFWKYPCLRTLLSKSICIKISEFSYDEGPENVVPDLDREGFQFLEDLKLRSLGVKRICDGQVPPQMFCKLRKLELANLGNLESYVLPIDVAPNLTTLIVEECSKLKYIWMENVAPFTQKQIYELHSLKYVSLSKLSNLLQALGDDDKDKSSTLFDMNKPEALFNMNKMRFPSLEELFISDGSKNEKLWEWDISKWKQEIGVRASPQFCPFPNLRNLIISFSSTIKTGIGPPSVATTLIHLENLQIWYCENMREVISGEKEDETEISTNIITFPKLRLLNLESLYKMECLYGGSYKVCFPALKEMKMHFIKRMTRFVGPTNTARILPEKVEFPSLQTLVISGTPVATPSVNLYSLFQNLRFLYLFSMEWKHAFSKEMVATIGLTLLTHLEELHLLNWNEMEEVVEEIDDGAILTPSSSSSFSLHFPCLTRIILDHNKKLRRFFSTRRAHIVLDFPSLQGVSIWGSDNMEFFSNTPVNAPNLVEVKVESRTMEKGDDINNFVSGIYKSQIRKGDESASTSSAT